MITRDDLVSYLDDLLSCSQFQDYAPNGLQIEGRSSIQTICTAVTASEAVIAEALNYGADALIAHHGFFWRGEESVITGMRRRRIGQVIAGDLNLYAYHLPLDCHATLGNNACLGQLLQLNAILSHDIGKTANILWSGEFREAMTAQMLIKQIGDALQQPPLHIAGTDKLIKRIAWCSGAAQDYIEDAQRLGVDAYLSGEISERTYYQALELNMHYFACGHHATERFGIQALGTHLAKQFNLDHQFIDSMNPV